MLTHYDNDKSLESRFGLETQKLVELCRVSSRGRGINKVIGLFIILFILLLAFIVPPDRPAYAASAYGNMTNGSVTDTQNVLGGQSGRISDEISSTYQQTGVHVRLLFLASFEGAKNPDRWVADVLQSTKPNPNTVMLAVASNDGRLVVAVSENSDRWLQNQKYVDQMSQAALNPLQKDKSPDWPGCAIAFMEEIQTIHHQRQTTRRIIIIVVCLAVILLVGVIAGRLLVSRSRRNGRGRHSANRSRK